MALIEPPAYLSEVELDCCVVRPFELCRVSRFSSGEPHFGRHGVNRFDDPTPQHTRRFGTCYLGFDLATAIAETILHDAIPERGEFSVSLDDLRGRYVVRFAGEAPLVVANLTGASLRRLGVDGALSTVVPPCIPQKWARAIHRHPLRVDGIVYMSRNLNSSRAVVLFDRSAAKLGATSHTPLLEALDVREVLSQLHISLDTP